MKGKRGPLVALGVVVLVVVVLVWVGGGLERPQTAPGLSAAAVPEAPKVETRQSLDSMAENYFTQGHYDDAIRVYQQILARSPNDAAVYNDLGLALHYSGRSDDAVEALEKATMLDPKMQRAWLSYGFVQMSMGRKTAARAALKKVVEMDPASPQGVEAKDMLAR